MAKISARNAAAQAGSARARARPAAGRARSLKGSAAAKLARARKAAAMAEDARSPRATENYATARRTSAQGKACSAPGRRSGGGSMSSGISMAVVAVDRVDGLDGALLLAGAVGSLVSQCWETRALRCTHLSAGRRATSRAGGHGVTTSTVSRIPTSRH